jgi:hypothetical protein
LITAEDLLKIGMQSGDVNLILPHLHNKNLTEVQLITELKKILVTRKQRWIAIMKRFIIF